jgi:fibronectin-binding autotransporter adhesin
VIVNERSNETCGRRRALTAQASRLAGTILVLSALSAVPLGAQTWANAGTGDWFVAGNWSPATVPVAGSTVIVSNGGTAELSGVSDTPVLGSLSIGLGSSGTGIGTVVSDGTSIHTSGGLNVGALFTTAGDASGTLSITGAGGSVGTASVGLIFGGAPGVGSGNASGEVTTDGSLLVNGGLLQVGRVAGVSAGSVATGALTIGGDAGQVSNLLVGTVSTLDVTQIGSQASGALSVGGDLRLAGGASAFIGTASDARLDLGAGVVFNTAQGAASIGGTLALDGLMNTLQVGVTPGGVAHGTLTVGHLDTGGYLINNMSVGSTTQGGQATGLMSVTTGDLHVGTLSVGNATGGFLSGGSATGTLQIGGTITGAGISGLSVGTAATGAGHVVHAQGTIESVGLSGFTSYNVGTLSGFLGSGSSAEGFLGLGSGGLTSSGGVDSFIRVGAAFSSFVGIDPSGATASGTVQVAGGDISGFGNVIVGESFRAGATATGTLELNQGTLSSPHLLGIGRAAGDGDTADGTLRLSRGAINMAATTPGGDPANVGIGVALEGGHAVGRLLADESTLSLGRVSIGVTSGDMPSSAHGVLSLLDSELEALRVTAGIGFGAGAEISLVNSLMHVADDFLLGAGSLHLENSLLTANTFELRDNATLTIDINGLLRGLEYGAIDAHHAQLAGVLRITMGNLLPFGPLLLFDLVRATPTGAIFGDFSSILFFDVPVGYSAFAGLEFDGSDVYRLRLEAVPEPGLLLMVSGGLIAVCLRRRTRAARSRAQ